jgi:Peptidase propeptide and YPEB domain
MPTIKRIIPSLVLAAAGMLAPGQVLADRPPGPEERSSIETVLRNEGFTRWGKIGLEDDDDIWKIDDAYASDGRKYDLQLEPDTLAIIAREPDDD